MYLCSLFPVALTLLKKQRNFLKFKATLVLIGLRTAALKKDLLHKNSMYIKKKKTQMIIAFQTFHFPGILTRNISVSKMRSNCADLSLCRRGDKIRQF